LTGNTILITGGGSGIHTLNIDIDDREGIRGFARKVTAAFPAMNVSINNAGIQRPEDLRAGRQDLQVVDAMVTTSLLGPIRVTVALLPLLQRQPHSTVINVTSALAFVPGVGVPTYGATKAAMHSYALCLREQLRRSSTEVIELIPPYVQTDLGPNHATDPRACRSTSSSRNRLDS